MSDIRTRPYTKEYEMSYENIFKKSECFCSCGEPVDLSQCNTVCRNIKYDDEGRVLEVRCQHGNLIKEEGGRERNDS